jgi:hypothetical protein
VKSVSSGMVGPFDLNMVGGEPDQACMREIASYTVVGSTDMTTRSLRDASNALSHTHFACRSMLPFMQNNAAQFRPSKSTQIVEAGYRHLPTMHALPQR